MTPVQFTFLTPDGQPVGNAEVDIQLLQPTYDSSETGVLMPRLVSASTDDQGNVTVSLTPSDVAYQVVVYDPASDAALSYKFYVPQLTAPNTFVRFQDLIVDAPMPEQVPYDQAALLVILTAKANTISAEISAQTSEANAYTYASQSATSANASATSANSILGAADRAETAEAGAVAAQNAAVTSESHAAGSATAAATSATQASSYASAVGLSADDAANSARAAATSATNAATSASNAQTSATGSATSAKSSGDSAASATISASAASTSQTAAAGSAKAASDSAAAALSSQGSASTFATNANTSATNSANSATAASTSATAAHTSELNAADSASSSQKWATQTNIEVVPGQGYGAKKYANDAAASATASSTSASNAHTSELNAAGSATTAAGSATAANTSAGNAHTAELNADAASTLAKNWASQQAGQVDGVSYSAAYYAAQAAASAASANSSANAAVTGQIQSDWNTTDNTAKSYIVNKPALKAVATTGSYVDLTNKPVIPTQYTDALARAAISVSGSLAYNSATGVISYTAPVLATVAASGSYADLTNKPALVAVATSGNYADLTNKPALSTVATSGSYADLSNKPVIPSQYTDALARAAISVAGSLAYNAVTGVISYTAPALATVATSGSYADLTGKPSIPANVSQLVNDSNFITAAGAPVQSINGKTGAAVLAAADLGLGNVNNTSDANKPVSTAQQTALNAKQDASAKDATGGYVGMTGFNHNLKNPAGTINSQLTSIATAARTWTFPDKSDTVAMLGDLSSVQSFKPGDLINTAQVLAAPAWLPCNGSIYLQSSYPTLFAMLGARFTGINLPTSTNSLAFSSAMQNSSAFSSHFMGVYGAVSTTAGTNIFKRSNGTYTLLATLNNAGVAPTSVRFSRDTLKLAIVAGGSVYLYKRTPGTDTFTYVGIMVATTGTLGAATYASLNNDGTIIGLANAAACTAQVFSLNTGDTGYIPVYNGTNAAMPSNGSYTNNNTTGVHTSPDGSCVVVMGNYYAMFIVISGSNGAGWTTVQSFQGAWDAANPQCFDWHPKNNMYVFGTAETSGGAGRVYMGSIMEGVVSSNILSYMSGSYTPVKTIAFSNTGETFLYTFGDGSNNPINPMFVRDNGLGTWVNLGALGLSYGYNPIYYYMNDGYLVQMATGGTGANYRAVGGYNPLTQFVTPVMPVIGSFRTYIKGT